MYTNLIFLPHLQVFLEQFDYGFGLFEFFFAQVIDPVKSVSQSTICNLASPLAILEYFIIEDTEVQAD